MTAIRQILAATDLSTPARQAASRAAWLAQEHQAGLTLQHVVDQGALTLLESVLESIHRQKVHDVVDQSTQQLHALCHALENQYDIEITPLVDSGRVVRALVGAIADVDPDLVVLGARGANFVRHVLLGSTPERLLSRVRKPILVVRQTPRAAYRNILVPVDFSPRSFPALALAHAVAPQASITALHVHHVPFENRLHLAGVNDDVISDVRQRVHERAQADMATLMERCQAAGIPATPALETGEPAPTILECEQSYEADLVVLGRHAHDPLSELAVGSVARHILAHAQSDVLIAGKLED